MSCSVQLSMKKFIKTSGPDVITKIKQRDTVCQPKTGICGGITHQFIDKM